MSGTIQGAPTATMSVSSGQAGVVPVSFGYYPVEGSRAVSAQYSWTGTQTGFTEDLSQLAARGMETTPQTLFIDNSSCYQAVTINIFGSNQTIVVPSNFQGVYPALFTGSPGYTITGGTSGVTRVYLLNVPASGGLWSTVSVPTRAILALDVSSVTTGGTAVTALAAGHRTAGGWIMNPTTATTNLGINEIGTASGTTSAGSTTFIAPGQSYSLVPSPNAVSVIASDSSHAFSGYGFQ